jgi:hypothetical protein
MERKEEKECDWEFKAYKRKEKGKLEETKICLKFHTSGMGCKQLKDLDLCPKLRSGSYMNYEIKTKQNRSD